MKALKFNNSFLEILIGSASEITGEKLIIEREFESADSFTFLLSANNKYVGKIFRFEHWPPPGKIDYIHNLLDDHGIFHEEMVYSSYDHPHFIYGWQISKFIPANTVKYLKQEFTFNNEEYLEKMGQLFKKTHSIKMDFFGSLSSSKLQFSTYQEHLSAELNELNFDNSYTDKENLEIINSVKTKIMELAEILKISESALVHDDANTGNILWHNNQPVLIDWVDSLAAPPIRDMANLTFTKDVPTLQFIEKGYGNEINRTELLLHQMVRLLRLVHFYFYEEENIDMSNQMLKRLGLLLNKKDPFGI